MFANTGFSIDAARAFCKAGIGRTLSAAAPSYTLSRDWYYWAAAAQVVYCDTSRAAAEQR